MLWLRSKRGFRSARIEGTVGVGGSGGVFRGRNISKQAIPRGLYRSCFYFSPRFFISADAALNSYCTTACLILPIQVSNARTYLNMLRGLKKTNLTQRYCSLTVLPVIISA